MIEYWLARSSQIHGAAHTWVLANGLVVNRYLCTYLFTAHIITPLHVLRFCAEPSGLLLLLDFVVLFSTFLIQCVAWEIPSKCSGGVLKDDALSNSLHDWIFLVSNILWTDPVILFLSTSGSAYPWPFSTFVVSCHWPPLLTSNFLFVVAWGSVCAPFLPKRLLCIRPPNP